MKKIFLSLIIILSMLLISNINISANNYNMLKKLYVVLGSTDILDYPGYELIETDVNYHKEGLYTAKYVEDITDRIFTREIEVVSSNTIINNGIKSVILKEEYTIDNAKILKKVATTSCDIIVYEKEDYCVLRFIYIDSYDEKKIFDSNIFSFVDLVYSCEENKLYIIGNIYTNSIDVYIGEYSLNKVLLKEKIIKGNNVDLVKNIHIKNGFIYLTGNTNSSTDDFKHTVYSEDSFVIKLDLQTFDILKYLNLAEMGIDYIDKSCYSDYLYVFKHLYNSGIHLVNIYKLDDDLNIISNSYLGEFTFITDVNVKSVGSSIYYFCNLYDETLNDDVSTLYKISSNLSIKKVDSYYDSKSKAVDLNIVNGEISLLYTSSEETINYPTFIRIIGDNTIIFTLDNRLYNDCYFNEYGNLDLIYKDNLKSFEYSLVYSTSFGSTNSYEDVSPKIMCNNNKIKEDNYLSKIYIDLTLFGTYNLIYYYKFEFFDLVYEKDFIVKDEVMIDDNNIYNVGLVVNFLGKGYLNDTLIESNYVINEPGIYELKVIGYEDKTLIYNFEVVNLDENKTELTTENVELYKEVETTDEVKKLNIKENYLTSKIVNEKYESKLWYIIIPVAVILFSITLFTFIGRKVK